MSPFSRNRHPRGDLSAYADGQLTPDQSARIASHLEGCEACSRELAEVEALRSALSGLPDLPAPRSFTLTPEQAARPVRVTPAPGRSTALVNGLRIASGGLAAALAVVILLDSGAESPGDDSRREASHASSTEEYSGADTSDDAGIELAEPTLQAAPTPVSDVPAPEEQPTPTTDQSGSGQSSGGVGGVTTGGGTGGSGTSGGGVGGADATTEAVPPEGQELASDAARTTEPSTPTPDLGAVAITDAPDADAKDGSAAESAASDDEGGDGGDLPILEILLAAGAVTALGASIVLVRRRDRAA